MEVWRLPPIYIASPYTLSEKERFAAEVGTGPGKPDTWISSVFGMRPIHHARCCLFGLPEWLIGNCMEPWHRNYSPCDLGYEEYSRTVLAGPHVPDSSALTGKNPIDN